MWNTIITIIFAVEALLFLGFIIGRTKKRKPNETALFIGGVILLSISLNLVPYLHGVIVLKKESDIVLGLLDCLRSTLKLFVGESNVSAIKEFAGKFPHFSVAYAFGVIIALLTTISAAFEAFGARVTNSFRLAKALRQSTCDVIIGNTPRSIKLAEGCNSVLLLGADAKKNAVNELIESKHPVLCKNFTKQLLASSYFNRKTRYNIIYLDCDAVLPCTNEFIDFRTSAKKAKNMYLFLELEGEKAKTVRREIIEKSGIEERICTFSKNELLARKFTEENPVTKYLPHTYIENAAIKNGTNINVFILGFGKLSRELYRSSVMNNQLVTLDGEYKVLPINYFLCDTNIDKTDWEIDGLCEELSELKKNEGDYFPLPEIPYNTSVINNSPASREVLTSIKSKAQINNGFTFIIINTEDDFKNIELGAKLKSLLYGNENYHIFVRSEASYAENDKTVTYFGSTESIYSRDVIIDDSMALTAKKINEIYTIQQASDEEKSRSDFNEYILEKADKEWKNLSCFKMYSNIYTAINLRAKLNLLGLDYVKNTSGDTSLIAARYNRKKAYSYEEYFIPSVRTALLAQEHARWNAYHLLNEYLPMKKEAITVKSSDGKKIKFNTSNSDSKQHTCITTFNGINALSSYLAKKAGGGFTACDYDFYIYDENLILIAKELLDRLGYSTVICENNPKADGTKHTVEKKSESSAAV